MAYRRTYRRRGGSYRRPQRQLMWVRSGLVTVDLTATGVAFIDLLWRLKNPPTTFQSARLDYDPTALAPPDTAKMNVKDVTGAVVKRVRVNVMENMSITPEAGASIYYAITSESTFPVGAESSVQDISTQPSHPSQTILMNTADMLWWECSPLAEGVIPIAATTPAPASWIRAHKIDTRCARKIADWGDSLNLVIEPDLGNGNTGYSARVSSSILLSLP